MLLYRGFNNNYPNMGVRPNQKGIWMTDDEEYANEYAMLFKNGAIAEIDIDDDANIANVFDCEKVFEDDEDIENIGEYLADLGGDIEFDNQVCNKLTNSGYDGVMFDDSGVDNYYIFNRNIIKGYKIIKIMKNNREDAMESLCEGLGNKPVSFTAYHGGVEPDMTPDEGRAFYLTDDYDLAHQFARREVYDDGLYEGEIPTIFTYKGTFNNPYYLTDDEYDSEGQDSNIDYEKWVEMGVDGLVYEGQGGSTYYIVIDLSTIKLVDKKVYWEEEIKDDLDESINKEKIDIVYHSSDIDIENPSEKVQMTAVKEAIKQDYQDIGHFIKYWIKNPTPKVKEYVEKMKNIKESKIPSLRVDEKKFKSSIFNVLLESNILTEDIAAVKKYFPKVPEEKIQTLIELDPTYQGGNNLGKFGKWILGLYNKGQLKDEDFYKVPQYLTTFKDNLKKIQNKDIMSYKTLPDLAKAIQPFEGQKDVSKKQQVRDIKNNEAKKVLETSKWIIITPKTHKAACYYGANTKWCTASKENDTWFDNYNRRGPLYILINKESNEKYQVHFESLSFMNELDKSIVPNDVFKDDKKVYQWFLKTIDKELKEIFNGYDEYFFNSDDYTLSVYSKNRCELELDLYNAIENILRTDNNEVLFEPEEISGYIRDTSKFWNTVVPNYLRTHDDFEEKCNKLTRKYTNEKYYLHKLDDSLYFIDEYRKELIEKIDEKFNSEYIQYILDYLPEVYGNYEIEDECMFISIDSSEIINLIMNGYDKWEIKEKLEKKYAEYAYENPLNYSELDIRFQKEMEKIIFQSIKDWAKSDKQTEMKLENTINDILKNAGVKPLNESLDFYTSVKDSYGDELHCRMTVSEDGKNIGYLDFSVYEDTPYIQMINVKEPYRRKGYATQMIKQLQKEYPNSEINFGMTTDDGTKLVNSLPFDTKVNIEYDKKVKQAKKLKKWLDEFKEFTDKVYQQIDNNEPIAEKNRLYIVNNTDKWQKYKNKYEEILDWIRENKREKKFVKVDEKSKKS